MAGEWLNALAQAPNPGAAFADSFMRARQMKQQEAMQARQMQQEDEDRQLRRDQMQSQQALSQLEAHREKILMGAKVFREMKARNPGMPDEQVYSMTLPVLSQYGIDPAQLPQPGSPEVGQYVQGALAIADAFEKQGPQEPSFIREADALGIPRDEAAKLWRQKQGTVVINGIPHVLQGGDSPPVLTDDDIRRMDGGQTGSAPSGGFR